MANIQIAEKIIASKMGNKILEVILKDGKETGGIVQRYSEDLSEIELVNGSGDEITVSFKDIEEIHYM